MSLFQIFSSKYKYFTLFGLILVLFLQGCVSGSKQNKKQTILSPSGNDTHVTLEESNATATAKRENDFVLEHNRTEITTEQNSTDENVLTQDLSTQQAWQDWLSSFSDGNLSYAESLTYPWHQPTQRAIAQYDFENSDDAVWYDGAVKDNAHVKSGTYAVRFGQENDTLAIEHIAVEEGRWYVVSGYMYVDSVPADVMRYYVEFMRGDTPLDIPNYPMFASGKAGEWREFILPVYIKKGWGIDQIRLVFRNVGTPDAAEAPKSDVWIDNVAIYPVEDSASLYGRTPPAPKRGFDGALVKVDVLGNFSLRSKTGYRPFLPIIIYPGGKQESWHKYREKGFNTIICNSVQEAKRAVSLGMHWIWSLYDYGIYDGDESGYARFEREYRELKEQRPDVLEKLLYFYWDNERYLLFDTVRHFSETIRRIDVDATGKRLRPFMMQLDFTMANPHYLNDTYRLIDLQSCYANPMIFEANDPQNYQGVEFKGNYDGEFANFAIFEHSPEVKIPKTVFVVNSPFGDRHIANTIFAAFARGGRGVAYWKDGGSQPPVETKTWWGDFQNVTQKLQKLAPLLRTPHWTQWRLHSSVPDDESGVVFGTRDFGGKRCMIVASRSDRNETVRFDAQDPVPEGTAVIDYFTGKTVAQWHQKYFELNLAPRGYGAYCWDFPVE